MCCNKRRQRRAQEAAIIAAAAKLHDAQLGPKSHLLPTTSLVSGNGEHAILVDAPPPYPAAAREVTVDEKLAPSESAYDTIAREWLDAGNDKKDRRPSFNAFHSFDAHHMSTREEHVQNSQRAFAQNNASTPVAVGGVLGWLVRRQQHKRSQGCCGRRHI